jgi:hypothetical protein
MKWLQTLDCSKGHVVFIANRTLPHFGLNVRPQLEFSYSYLLFADIFEKHYLKAFLLSPTAGFGFMMEFYEALSFLQVGHLAWARRRSQGPFLLRAGV